MLYTAKHTNNGNLQLNTLLHSEDRQKMKSSVFFPYSADIVLNRKAEYKTLLYSIYAN